MFSIDNFLTHKWDFPSDATIVTPEDIEKSIHVNRNLVSNIVLGKNSKTIKNDVNQKLSSDINEQNGDNLHSMKKDFLENIYLKEIAKNPNMEIKEAMDNEHIKNHIGKYVPGINNNKKTKTIPKRARNMKKISTIVKKNNNEDKNLLPKNDEERENRNLGVEEQICPTINTKSDVPISSKELRPQNKELKTPKCNTKTLKYMRLKKKEMEIAMVQTDDEEEYFKENDICNIEKLVGDWDNDEDSILTFKTPTIKLKSTSNITPRTSLLQQWTNTNSISSPKVSSILKKYRCLKRKDCALQVYYHINKKKRVPKKKLILQEKSINKNVLKLPDLENSRNLHTSMEEYFDDSD